MASQNEQPYSGWRDEGSLAGDGSKTLVCEWEEGRMPKEIHPLKPVSLRKVWPNEARDFTPWLAKNLDLLAAALCMELELDETEVRVPPAGQVDIIARQAQTDAKVVIENQLGNSDDSHCLRLLGYAAGADAYILVWVARHFTEYHRIILDWVNQADTIDAYAVTVQVHRVGDDYAVHFRPVVEPSRLPPERPSKVTWSTLFAEFYRPLRARLRRSGVYPVGRGGFRGRWRSFETGYPDAIYSTGLVDGKARVSLILKGLEHRRTYDALLRYQAEIDAKVDQTINWRQGDRHSWLRLETEPLEAVSQWGPEEDLDTVRERMEQNLLQLRAAVQPYLDKALGVDQN